MHRKPIIVALLAVVAAALLTTAVASGRSQAAPANTTAPAVSGTAKVGQKLTTSNGTWANSPTTYAYQWQRCTSSTCADIAGAAEQTYTLGSSDAGHTVRSVVTASNADGKSTANSNQTSVVAASGGSAPANTLPPVVLGDAVVGQQLIAGVGQWTGSPTFSFQWQRCSALGTSCGNIAGGTARRYPVVSTDYGHTLRVGVTATNSSGSLNAISDVTAVVTFAPKLGNRAPRITFISLKWVGRRVYAKFQVCDDTQKAVTVFERDSKKGVLSYGRKFSVTPSLCVTATRNWRPAPRFRTGRLTVTLQAVDKSRAGSRLTHRTLVHR